MAHSLMDYRWAEMLILLAGWAVSSELLFINNFMHVEKDW